MATMTLKAALNQYPDLILSDGTNYWEQDQLLKKLLANDPEALEKVVYCDPEGIWEMTSAGNRGQNLYATVRCPFCHDLIYWSDHTEALEGLAHTYCDAKDWH